MPFSRRWFYGDVLFIVDPWIWLFLGAGWWASRHRWARDTPRAGRPARWGLLVAAGYVLLMGVSGVAARHGGAGRARGARLRAGARDGGS